MANEYDSYNEETQREKIKAGMKGGPFFKSPILHPKMTIVDAVPSEVKEKAHASKPKMVPIANPWG